MYKKRKLRGFKAKKFVILFEKEYSKIEHLWEEKI